MSSVDERIVKMVFDNADFATKIAGTIKSLTQLNQATEQVANNSGGGLSAMGKAFEQAEIMSTKAGFHIQDVWLKVASILEYQVAGKIVKIGKDIANAMTFEGIADGFNEYELKMGSVQTIMAGTGASLGEVNRYLNELNTYSDKTIYSFADMTNNIGKFTNAGVELEDAVLAIKGIANEAARSGANANEASRAMYNFSQALSAGYVKLIDWKSIENANMATKEFKDTLLEVAVATGTVEKGEDGMYKVLSKNAQGATMKETISATKNFNDSLSYQWMTTEVLTETMKVYATDIRDMTKAEKEAYENELRSMGITDEQIKKFEELGSAATDAASEVKTFTMLKDTLKEAIGSGWAQTWELIIGNFDEAKQIWTAVSNVLGDFIDKSSDARNYQLQWWKTLGGRKALIDSFANAFKAIQAIIKPISEGLKDVFPPATGLQLANLTKALRKFTEGLIISEETANKVKRVATGFFSIFDIALKFIKAFIGAILPAGKGVLSLGDNLLDAAANIGDFITQIDKAITENKLFEKAFENIAKIVKPVFEIIKMGASGILQILSSLFSGFSDAAQPMETVGDIFQKVVDNIANGIDNIKDKLSKLSPIFGGIKSLFSGVGEILGSVFKQIGDSLSGFASGNTNGFSVLINSINALISGGILYKLYQGVKQFSEVGGILDSLGSALDSFGKKVGSETLLNTAKAVGILAVSLLIVASIDSDKLAGAVTAISTMVGVLAGAMMLIMKAVNSFSATDVKKSFSFFGKELFGSNATKILEMSITLGAVSKALVAMGAAILMMAIGLKIVSKAAEGGHLWDSFAVISLMLGELTLVAIALGKWGNDSKKGAKGLIAMTSALILMAVALKMVSQVVEGGNAWESLGIIGLMVAGLTGVLIAIDKLTKYKSMSMLPLISMAISINLLVFALKSISDALGTEGNHIWEALGIVGLMAAGLAAVCVVLSKFGGFAAVGGVGAILAAAAILIFVQSLKQISDALGQTDQHIWQALGVIAVSLLVLAVGLTAMAGTIPGAAGLLIASVALIALGGALKIIGKMSLAEIGKGLLAIAGSLIILAVGLTAMIVALPGAAALVVAAFGLTILAGVLKIFGSMSLEEIGKSLLTLAAALAGIAVIGAILSITSPLLLAFSVALTVFGVSLIATGIGLSLFAAGMQALVAIVPMGTEALRLFGETLLGLIPVAVTAVMDAIGILCTKIVEYGPQIVQAIITVIGMILTALVSCSTQIAEAIVTLLLSLMDIMSQNIPKFAQKATDMMVAFMKAISTEIPRVVDEGYKCAIALINGLADAIRNNNGELIAAVDNLMDAAIQAITQWLVEFTPLGMLIPEDMKNGIMDGSFNVKDAIDDLIKDLIDKIKSKYEDFKKAAKNLIDGFLSGLTGGKKEVSDAGAAVGDAAIDGLNSKKGIDSNSPSKRAEESGAYVDEGLIKGMEDNLDLVTGAGTDVGNELIGSINDAVNAGLPDLETSSAAITDALTIEAGSVDVLSESFTSLTDSTMEAIDAQKEQEKQMDKNQQIISDLSTETARAESTQQKYNDAVQKSITAQLSTEGLREEKLAARRKEIEETQALTDAIDENTDALGGNGKAAKKSADVMEYASGVVEAFAAQYGELYAELGEDAPIKVATFAVRNLAEETYKASIKAKQAAGENEKTVASVEDMIKAFTELKTNIYDSVKSMFEGDNFFQVFEKKTDKSMADMLAGMRSNVEGVKDWTNKLSALANTGIEQGLLQQLAELGPKGFEYVNAFSNATAEEIEEANRLFLEASTIPESASNSVVASYAKAGLNAVAGFANGINSEAYAAIEGIENVGTTTLNALETILEENSPSKATERMGMYLDQGLENGIKQNALFTLHAAMALAEDIKKAISGILTYEVFFGYGQNVAYGLADGMTSEDSIKSVTEAAKTLSKIAASVTEKYNGIESPAKRYRKYGTYIAKGFGLGMTDGTSYVQHGAYMLSDAIKTTLDLIESISEDDMELHPVISPVLDLNDLKNKAGLVNSLFPQQSMAMASTINIGRSTGGSSDSSSENVPAFGGQQINFTQNNYSPKALSRYDIYRDTKNQISMMKGVIAHA